MKTNPENDSISLKMLGQELKAIRLKKNQSRKDVASSIEVSVDCLKKIEEGLFKPSEDTLEALAEHYKLKDEELDKWFKLVGYVTENPSFSSEDLNSNPINVLESLFGMNIPKTFIMLSRVDQKPVYTDLLDIHYDQNGIMFNFKQSLGNKEPKSISKLVMSYDHAECVLQTLKDVLIKVKYSKHIQPPSGSK